MMFGPIKKYLSVWLFLSLSVFAATRREVVFWGTRSSLPMDVLDQTIEPTLPPPLLQAEPPYTQGSTNTLYWNSDAVQEILQPMGYRLVVFEIEAQIDTLLLWGFVDVGIDSAVFMDLPEGIRIEYRLRYYAEKNGQYEMSHWSIPVFSVQDIRAPCLIRWDIEDLQQVSGMQDWVVGQTLRNRVIATDSLSSGVMQVVIVEKRVSSEDTTFFDLEMPLYSVNIMVPYPVLAPANEPVQLTLWVVDAAGHVSEKMTRSLFWWDEDPQTPAVICYPNPFRPALGEKAVIKLNASGFQKGRVFDPFGNPIKVLFKPEESLFFEWDGTNQEGARVARGGYLFVIDGHPDLYCKIAVY